MNNFFLNYNRFFDLFDLLDNPVKTTTTKVSDKDLTFTMEVPGFGPEDIEVTLDSRTFTVEIKNSTGTFIRNFSLPDNLNLDYSAAKAVVQKGVLTIRFPTQPPKTNQTKIKVTAE